MSFEKPITILIAEDQEILRFGIKCALDSFSDLKVIAQSCDGVSAILDALAVKPDVILMDIGLPKIDGIKAAKQIKEALPGVRIIMLTSSDDDEAIYAALGAGADGYCLKDVDLEHLHSAVQAVAKGITWIDPGLAERVLQSQHLKQQMSVFAQPAKLAEDATTITKAPALIKQSVLERTELSDRYSINSTLGSGGMGIVYKATHLLMERPVAIKMLHKKYISDDIVTERFLSEAKHLSTLSHPNLVAVFDFGMTASDEPYMVMEYHGGKGLNDILEQHSKIEQEMAIHIFCQVCDALNAVHQNNMVHRDVKPGNILISPNGDVKLVDFGIAKTVDSVNLNVSLSGEVVGTPKYMSPEQCLGKRLDARSDIYALGCVMYEVFTGNAPFDADSFYDMVRQHLGDVPSSEPFDQPSVNLPQALSAIILKALEKDPADRQQTVLALKEDLLSIAGSNIKTN